MMRAVALSFAALHFSTSLADNCSLIQSKGACKDTRGCKWQKKEQVCFGTDGPVILDPTPAPTDAPTDAPTEAPTDSPTDAPTDAPVASPTEPPTNPTEQADCGFEVVKSVCNRTPTCVYQNKEHACVGCSAIDSKSTCGRVVGCLWKQKQCMFGIKDDNSHPHDEKCKVHSARRHCKQAKDCEWTRNGKCRGHQGCGAQKNNIDCRSAHKCFWLPNQNRCVDEAEVEP